MTKEGTVLLVEDEAIPLLFLRKFLGSLGFGRIACESSGKAAVDRASLEKPELVIMDIGLPGELDGIDAAAQILALRRTRLLFITGYADGAIRSRAEALDPAGYFIKPLDLAKMKAAILETSR